MQKHVLIIGAIALLSASAALAQMRPGAMEAARACRPDIRQFCGEVPPRQGRIKACMKAHVAELSEPVKKLCSRLGCSTVMICSFRLQTLSAEAGGGGRTTTDVMAADAGGVLYSIAVETWSCHDSTAKAPATPSAISQICGRELETRDRSPAGVGLSGG
jgi:hypothetical protein